MLNEAGAICFKLDPVGIFHYFKSLEFNFCWNKVNFIEIIQWSRTSAAVHMEIISCCTVKPLQPFFSDNEWSLALLIPVNSVKFNDATCLFSHTAPIQEFLNLKMQNFCIIKLWNLVIS